MKKLVSLLLALLMIGMLSTALAAEVEPGADITIDVAITGVKENGRGAGYVFFDASSAPVTCKSAKANNQTDNSQVVAPPKKLSGKIAVIGYMDDETQTTIVKTGTIATLVFTVNADAQPGTYTISVWGTEDITAASGTTTFTIAGCVECIPDEGEVTKKPTCKEEGEKTYKCTECGKVCKTEKLPVVAHDYTDEIVTLEPTCTEDGVMSFACTMCGEVSKTEPIEKLGHDEGEVVTVKEPTCVENGLKQSTCKRCGTLIVNDEIPALGHKEDEGTVTTEPACEEEGTKTYKCTICGVPTKTEPVPATGHKVGESEVTKEPTCTEPGLATGSCTVCGKELENSEIPAKGHTKDEGTVTLEPTCTATGVKTYKCSVCGEELETEELPMVEHTEDEGTVTTEPTCTEAGVKTYKCSVCGKELRTEEVPALGHTEDEGTVTVEPTCTTEGVKVIKCSVCGEEIRTEVVPALGHVPGEWVIVKPATGNEDGLKELYCSVCGELIETAVIPGSVWFHMTVSSIGPRFRDVSDLTNKWNMFTVVDLSVDGEQTFDLIAGDIHVVGTMTVKVADGKVTVTYKLVNKEMSVKAESLSIVGGLDAITSLDELPAFNFGEEISIADQLGGDTVVLIYINNVVHYESDVLGLKPFIDGRSYTKLVEEMMAK